MSHLIPYYLLGDEIGDNCMKPEFINNTGYDSKYYGNKLLTPFLISGVLQAFSAFMLAVMYFTHKYVPDSKEEEKEVIEKEIEEVLKPIEKLYQRRYTVQILEENSDSRANSLKRKQMLPRYSIQVMGNHRKSFGSLRHRNSTRYYTVPIKRRFSSFQMLDEMPRLPSKMPKNTIIGLGAVCFATAIVSEAAFIDFSPKFFSEYSDIEGKLTS